MHATVSQTAAPSLVGSAITTSEASSVLAELGTYPACSLCGTDKVFANPEEQVEAKSGNVVTCQMIAQVALMGVFAPDECLVLQSGLAFPQCQYTPPVTNTTTTTATTITTTTATTANMASQNSLNVRPKVFFASWAWAWARARQEGEDCSHDG
jgi:hypothetical protein